MPAPKAARCACLLLLHLALMAGVAGKKPRANPRGWEAAKIAEREARQAAAAASGWAPPPTSGMAKALPAGAAWQPTCGVDQLPDWPAHRTAWGPLATGAALSFPLGLLAGMALQTWLVRRRGRRRSCSRSTGGQEGAASCSASGRAAMEGARQQLHPAGAEEAAAVAPAAQPPASLPAAAFGTAADASMAAVVAAAGALAAEGVGESPAPARAAAAKTDSQPQEPASEAAVAAAVQDLVLQQSTGSSSGGGGSAAEGAAGTAAGQQQQAQALAVAQSGHGGAALGTLGTLRQDEREEVQAAAALVLTMCRSMHIEPAELSRGERLQLIYTMLQAWQAQQGRRHAEEMSRLGSEANILRSQQRDIAAQAAARQAAKDAYRLSLERTAAFRRMCSDTLTFGLVVMVAAAAYQVRQRGLLLSVAASCGSLAAAFGGRGWGLWAAWRAAEALACYALGIGDALLGLAALLAAPWLLYRSGLLSDYHTMPITKLAVGLGLMCGLAGYVAVGKLGGSCTTWLAAWEAWVALHIAFSAAAHRVQRISLRAQQAADSTGSSSMYESGGGWLPVMMWAVLGMALPLLAGTLPFRA